MSDRDKRDEPVSDCTPEEIKETSDNNQEEEGSVINDLKQVLSIPTFKRKKRHESVNPESAEAYACTPDEDVNSLSVSQLSIDNNVDLTVISDCQQPSGTERSLDSADIVTEKAYDIFESELSDEYLSKKKGYKVAIFCVAALLLVTGGIFLWPYLTEPKPPGENVVGSYNGKYITTEELQKFIVVEQTKEQEHIYCETHGYDHAKCEPTEECEAHPIDSLEGYRQMVTRLAVEQMIQDWAAEQGVNQREDVQHGLEDFLNDANVSQFIDQLHEEQITPDSIPSLEVQQYYNDNKESYNGKSLSEVEDEIRQILVSRKDAEFFPKFIEELKQTAGLQVNFDLLKITEPTDEEITSFYKQNSSEYQTTGKAEILEIKIISADAQSKARDVIRKIRSGESFDSVAATYSQDKKAIKRTIEKDGNDDKLQSVIWRMQAGDISEPIDNSDGSSSIFKLVSISKAGTQPLSAVKSDIRLKLLQKNMEREYMLRKDEALFSVHSKRYTLGDFYREFTELSPEYQAEFSTLNEKKQLVEQLIAKELLLEENDDNSLDEKEQHGYEELKIQYLSQILHQEEVDAKLKEPTEEEMRQFYEQNKDIFYIPESLRLSLIWVDQGQDGEKSEQARKKAEEALSQLNSGVDFAEVARKYSEDGSSASGGEIGETFYKDELPKELATEVSKLKTGEVSGIIDYQSGYYIIRVQERNKERQQPYEEAAEGIKEHLNEQKHDKLQADMEKILLEKANFTIYNKTLRQLLKS
jgi:parvulin-like peptidyl-prolyl isomerase